MTTKFATTIMGSLIITLTCSAVASAGGQLFVTNSGYDTPIKRLDSQTFELLGELPGTETFCCRIDIDPYRRYIWGPDVRDFDFNEIHGKTAGAQSTFSAVGNSYWRINKGFNSILFREPYDQSTIYITEAAFSQSLYDSEKEIVAYENDVYFVADNTIRSLTDPIFELPFTAFELLLQTVKDDFLYFAYRPSATDWHNVYRIRTDGTDFEELASGFPHLKTFDVDPDSETIFFQQQSNFDGSELQGILAIGFGDSTPTLICELCGSDVDFVADDEWFLPGDTDLDHDIDLSDYISLASNFNPELERNGPVWAFKTVRQGDFNGDWKIDISDYNTLASNFSPAGYTGPFGETFVSEVPEPSAIILASLALILLGGSRGFSENRCGYPTQSSS